MFEAQRQNIMRRITERVFEVGIAVGSQIPAMRVYDINAVARFGKCPMEMREFGPSESDGPACYRRDTGIGGDHQDAFGGVTVNGCGHGVFFRQEVKMLQMWGK